MRMRFADPFGESQLAPLAAAGHQRVVQPSTATELPPRIDDVIAAPSGT